MFLLTVIEDKIKILPSQFGRNSLDVLKEQVEIKYTNRIILDVGLCITFYDFIDVGDPFLYPSEGSSIQVVRFRMVVFRPFIGESIVGKVTKSTKEGLHLSVEFFDEIFVPSSLLQSPSVYNPSTGLWIWKYGENQDMDFEMGLGEEIRFKVRSISFTGLINSAKGITATTTSEERDDAVRNADHQTTSHEFSAASGVPAIRRRSSSVGLHPEEEKPSAMQVIGAINDFGLGLISWW